MAACLSPRGKGKKGEGKRKAGKRCTVGRERKRGGDMTEVHEHKVIKERVDCNRHRTGSGHSAHNVYDDHDVKLN